MNWRSGPALAAALGCCLCILNGCGNTEQPSRSSEIATTRASEASGNAAEGTSQAVSVPAIAKAAGPSAASSPNGETLEDLTALNVPLYPNVFERGFTDTSVLALAALTGKKADNKGRRLAQMTSHDSFDAVYAWYHERMPHGSESDEAAASNHTADDGSRMAVFEVGTTADPIYQHVMIIGKPGDDTQVVLLGTVTR